MKKLYIYYVFHGYELSSLERDCWRLFFCENIHIQQTVQIRLLEIEVQVKHLLADLHHPFHVFVLHSTDVLQLRHLEKIIKLCPLLVVVKVVLADMRPRRFVFTFH